MGRKSFGRLLLSGLALFSGIAALAIQGVHQPTRLEADGQEDSNNITITFDFNDVVDGTSLSANCISYGLTPKYTTKETQAYNPTYNYGWADGGYVEVGGKYTYAMKSNQSSIFYNTETPYLENYYISNLKVSQNASSYNKATVNCLITLSTSKLSSKVDYASGTEGQTYFSSTTIESDLSVTGDATKTYKYFQIGNLSKNNSASSDTAFYIDKITITYTPINPERTSSYADVNYSNLDYATTLGPAYDANQTVSMEKINGSYSTTDASLKLRKNQMLHFKASSEYAILGIRIAFESKNESGNTLVAGTSVNENIVSSDSNIIFSNETAKDKGGVYEWNPVAGRFYNEIYIQNYLSSGSDNPLVPTNIQVWTSKVMDSHYSVGTITSNGNKTQFVRFEGSIANWAINDYFSGLSEYGFEISKGSKTIKEFNSSTQMQVSALYSNNLVDDSKYVFNEGYSNTYNKPYFYTYGFILESIPSTFSGTLTFTSYAVIGEKNVSTSSQSITLTALSE